MAEQILPQPGQPDVPVPPRGQVLQPAGRRQLRISGFKTITHAATAGAERDHVLQEYPADRTTYLYVPETELEASRVFMYCLDMMVITGEQNGHDLMGLYCSAVGSVFRGTQNMMRACLRQMGIAATVIRMPIDSRPMGIELPQVADFTAVMVMVGQLVLIPFKSISVAGFETYMHKRALALKAHTSCYLDVNILNHISRRQAEVIKSGIGSSLSLKRGLLRSINAVSGTDSLLSSMCNYLLGIIAWTDMSAIVFIHDTLLISDSPVLRDPRVRIEILNLGDAFREILKFPQPQFFRILGDVHLHHLLNRNNYPVLAAVASCLRSESSKAASQFVPTMNREDVLVKELCEMHRNANLPYQSNKFVHDFDFLTDRGPGDFAID